MGSKAVVRPNAGLTVGWPASSLNTLRPLELRKVLDNALCSC